MSKYPITKLKKEKYIYEMQKESLFFVVRLQKSVKYRGQHSTEYIRIADYDSPSDALSAAVIVRERMLHEARLGTLVNKYPTVQELYDESFNLIPVAKKTRERHDLFYRQAIQQYADIPINDVSAAMVQKSLNLYAKEHSQDMVRHFMTVWKRIYRTALLNELDISDKSMMVKIPVSKILPKRTETKTTKEDYLLFLDALQNYQPWKPISVYRNKCYWFALQIMYYTGLRPSETFALSRESLSHIHEELPYIAVYERVGSTSENRRQIITLKTDASASILPIADELVPILDELLAWSKTDPLLCDHDGLPVEIDYFSQYISAVAKSAGIKFNAYMLRHLFATDVHNSTPNIRTLQSLMRHADPEMSMKYNNVDMEAMVRAVKNRSLN